jgi:hypothetical protein
MCSRRNVRIVESTLTRISPFPGSGIALVPRTRGLPASLTKTAFCILNGLSVIAFSEVCDMNLNFVHNSPNVR